MVGLDFSRAMLAEARRRFRHANAAFVRGDMRRLGFDSEFDGVINLFTSFGYFSPRDNGRALSGMARALRKGGRLLIDTRDRAYQERHPAIRSWSIIGPRYVFEDMRFDPRSGRVESDWHIVRPGRKRVLRRSLRMYVYTLPQWKRMLRRAGLRFLRAYGGYDLSPHKPGTTKRLIILGERPCR